MKKIRLMSKEELIETIISNNGLSISHATMRNEDLIPAFIEVLSVMNRQKVRTLYRENDDLCDAMVDFDNEKESTKVFWESENATEICMQLFEWIDLESPKGFYFGSHIGDASDYGFWRNESDDDE